MPKSEFLSALNADQRDALQRRLLDIQRSRCFICEGQIDLDLHADTVDIDHIIPLDVGGGDDEQNFALTHASCNRSKGTSNLQVARRLKAFERMASAVTEAGERGVNLGHVLRDQSGSKYHLRLKRADGQVQYSLPEVERNEIRHVDIHHDELSKMDSFFTVLPIEYLHHDDIMNPRSIGTNLRGLLEEFERKRPQLHVALGWWDAEEGAAGKVRIFDGQHKAAAQILLGVRDLPVRVFLSPDKDVLLQANTNAGSKLKQVAFDTAVLHHLGSSLYADRLTQYRKKLGLSESDLSFSEQDVLGFFRGEKREVLKYILGRQKDDVIWADDNRLKQFIEWQGKSTDRPLSFSAVDRTFFKVFLYKKPLSTPLDEGWDAGENPRQLEQRQLVRIMNLYADVVFIDHWDLDIGGNRLEVKIQNNEPIPDNHLRAWRLAREEVLANVLEWVRVVITNYYNYVAGRVVPPDRVLHETLDEEAWGRVESFLRNLADLPCWIDRGLSGTVFGAKQNLDFWETIFRMGKAPTGQEVLAKPLNINEMIVPPSPPSSP